MESEEQTESVARLIAQTAGTYGDHVGRNVEFGGPGLAGLTLDQRRTLCTMCAELTVEFAITDPARLTSRCARRSATTTPWPLWLPTFETRPR